MLWTLYLLLAHPSYLPTIQHEIDTLDARPQLISNIDLSTHLPTLEAAISETLRLQPPVPIEILENISSQPVVLSNSDGTVIVQAGEQVLWSPWVMARLPYFWGENAEDFKPERWLTMEKRPTAFEHPVFNAGPRSCLGQPLARIELIYALAEVLRRYEFEPAWSGKRAVGMGLTASMVGGLPVRVKRRRTSKMYGNA